MSDAWRVVSPTADRVRTSSSNGPRIGKLASQLASPEASQGELPDGNEIDWRTRRDVERLCAMLRRVNSMDKPNGRLVLVSCTHYCAFTSSLSTRWSSWALQGDLILGRASRLYAFSGYHNRTSLPSRAIGMTTGTQEVRPSRSSRTKDSPPQISYAHSR